MAIRIVQLGTPRVRGEGLRVGTVRRHPRGVPKAEFASVAAGDVFWVKRGDRWLIRSEVFVALTCSGGCEAAVP